LTPLHARIPKRSVRLIVLLSALCLLTVMMIWTWLPNLTRHFLETSLLDRGMEEARLPLSNVGFHRASFRHGTISAYGQSLTWEKAEVTYSPGGLLSGNLSTLYLMEPQVRIHLPIQKETPPAQPPDDVKKPSLPRRPAIPRTGEVVADGAEPREKHIEREAVPSAPVVRRAQKLPSLKEIHRKLPTGGVLTRDGTFSLASATDSPLAIEAPFDVAYRNAEADGFLRLETMDSLLDLSWQMHESSTLTVTSRLVLGKASIRQLSETVSTRFRLPAGFATGGDLITLNLFVEERIGQPPQAAFTGDCEQLEVNIPGMLRLEFSGGKLTGRATGEGIEAGLAGYLSGTIDEGPQIDPFRIEALLFPEGKLQLQSDSFQLNWNDWQGSFAFRGELLNPYPGSSAEGHLEIASSGLEAPSYSIGPGSILIQRNQAWQVTSSPFELRREGRIWIEDGRASVDLSFTNGEGSFALFNAMGAHLGHVHVRYRRPPSKATRFDWSLDCSQGKPFLEGTLSRDVDDLSIEMDGGVDLDWADALLGWYGFGSFSVEGPNPTLRLSAKGPPVFLRGSFSSDLDNLNVSFPGEIRLEGLSGRLQLDILGLPRSSGLQKLQASRLRIGGATLEAPLLQWSLPTIRTLKVHVMEAEIEGGHLRIAPFTLDPFAPDFETQIELSRFPAGKILEWLGEDRFELDELISGKLPFAWKEGVLRIGTSRFQSEPDAPDAYFRFKDPVFLREQFASLTGVPPEFKEPLLRALLEEGIRLDNLQVLLSPGTREESISIRLEVSGVASTDEMVVPIEGLVVNNLISREDLSHFLGIFVPVEFPPEHP